MRIVYTRHDGGVSICCPSDECILWMSCGGIWNDRPRGYLDIQVERMIADGRDPDASYRFAKAVQFGGCTTAEALEIIRDRDCAHLGTAHELWDASEVPTDRWFRDAWSRSHNGGPISINLRLAKSIQMNRIGDAIFEENMKRQRKLMAPLEWDREWLRGKIMAVRDENELRAIWPEELASAF